ncbi:hypothetical protein [Oerskovia paurometabola]|uniref:hypothetical protein n=1 Tax=Oerskovia paurometabola TaxID=162170 RepID=UPI003422A8D0
MFEKPKTYPTAYTADRLDPDQADTWAAAWVLAQQEVTGGQILILTPRVRMPAGHPILERLLQHHGAVQASERALPRTSWRGGPVLAAWPDRKTLAEFVDDDRTTALCVLTWNESDFRAWAVATGALQLGGEPEASKAPPTISDAVVLQGLRTVTLLVNQNNTLKGGHEKSVAASALLTLKKHGHALDADEIYAWSLAEGWRGPRAEELRALITQINGGSRPRVGGQVLRSDIYRKWKAEASRPTVTE